LSVPESAIQTMVKLLTKESRRKLFDLLYEAMKDPKNVGEVMGIRKNEVYRYIKIRQRSRKKEMTPSPSLTYNIIIALLRRNKNREISEVLTELDRVNTKMSMSTKEYTWWKKRTVKMMTK